ncbi:arylsulfatase B-like [Cydia splendana]|uniref:arylsulfatase B-like n=1 Tax=Cydia splendana TaxID=1100963 RepID=UPI00300D09FD
MIMADCLQTRYAVILLIVMTLGVRGESNVKPNIVYILADDLGWDDVSFHGSEQVLTPNIDLLARSGVALQRFYSHCLCTPSRSALLTGKHAYTLGMQGYPLVQSEDRFLPLNEKILPQYLKELGYSTHLVGKWHVGMCRSAALPTARGFDTHFGHRGGYIDYYEYTIEESWSSGAVSGYDLYRNKTPAWDSTGYVTDLYSREATSIIEAHDPSSPLFLMVAHNAPHGGNDGAILQAPPDEVRRMRHIESQQRRILAAMVKKLDDSVGDIVKSLSDKGILNNTIIVFTSDNGGMTSGNSLNYGSNWPLRGIKMSPFEGAVRVAGLLWKANLNPVSRAWDGYMHISDWLPTLLHAVGADPPPGIDGLNQWDNIITNATSKRNEILEIDDFHGFYMIISGEYKLITGSVIKEYSNYQGHDLRGIIGSPPSYVDAMKKSTVYSVLHNSGLEVNMADDEVGKRYKVDCLKRRDERDVSLCYPENGTVCLYNIIEDPCETKDISKLYPDIVQQLLQKLGTEKNRTIPRILPLVRDPRSHPNQFNYAWSTWADHIK